MKRMILAILLIAILLSGCGVMDNYSLEANPFGHAYRVAEVLESNTPETSAEEKLLVKIDVACNLYVLKDTLTYDFQKIGELQKLELSKEDTRKGLWFCYQDSDRYELSVEEDDTVILTQLVNEEISWAYRLSRVDTISANLSSAGSRSHMQLNWYFSDTFSGNLQMPSRPDIIKKGTLGISTEDDSISELTLFEEYYTDGNVEYKEYALSKEDGFNISVETRYETGEQYAIYRIPFENGEYVFLIKFG